MHEFHFEKLEVYQRALAFVEAADAVLENAAAKVARSRVDQLTRASLSIPLNIAEGNGRWHASDRRQFFVIARGSVFECVAVLQVMSKRGAVGEELYKQLYADLLVLAKMLTKLMQYEDSRLAKKKAVLA